jgi:Flp pilus assembly pilin Flp
MRYRRRIHGTLFRPAGQALIEYALILVLVVMAMAIALAATGPAISNIFSNTVYNLIGLSGTPLSTIQNRGGGSSSSGQP